MTRYVKIPLLPTKRYPFGEEIFVDPQAIVIIREPDEEELAAGIRSVLLGPVMLPTTLTKEDAKRRLES